MGAWGDEVQLSVLPTAFHGFRLKQCLDPGDVVAAHPMQPLALYPSSPHGTLGLGGRILAGAAGADAGDEPRPDTGLAVGWGQVRPWSDHGQLIPCPVLPARPPVLPWISAGLCLFVFC